MKLLSWNIQWGRGLDGRVDLARIVSEAARFADFDILCLQEVADNYPELPGADRGNQFERLARRYPGHTVVEGPAICQSDGRVRRFGNLLLSRYPVVVHRVHPLAWPPDGAQPSMPRSAIEALVATPAGVIRVVTTHLEYYSNIQRTAQAKQLHSLHVEACARAHELRRSAPRGSGVFTPLPQVESAILCGDLNCAPDSEEIRTLTGPVANGPSFCDAWGAANPGKAHAATVGLHDREQWPEGPHTRDFILITEDLVARVERVAVDATTQASDHQPLLLHLRER